MAASEEPPSALNVALLEVISLVFTIVLAFLFGHLYSASAASAKLRAQGRSSFRHLLDLFSALQALGGSVAAERASLDDLALQRGDAIPHREVARTLDVLEVQVLSQLWTASSVMEDWRDILPEEVESLEQRNRELTKRDR